MRFAILSDIHGNLEPLKSVLEDAAAHHCSEYICLGDIVGIYGNSKECVQLIRRMKMACVKGNFDHYCSSETSLSDFDQKTAEQIVLVRQQLSDEDYQWLSELPDTMQIAGFTIVHATLSEPKRWQYVFDKHAASVNFADQNTPVCFFGHTHIPLAFIRNNKIIRGGTYTKFRIEKNSKYFINVGSVGQPRDGIPKSAYVIYDLDENSVELRRIPFASSSGAEGSAMVPVS